MILNQERLKVVLTLLVENIDRLSRQEVFTANNLLMDLIYKGLIIVTLVDKEIYSEETMRKNSSLFDKLIGQVKRAHDESDVKSYRLSKKWEAKRNEHDVAHKDYNPLARKLTSRCPGWLELNKNTNQYEPKPNAKRKLKKIFTMSIEGIGNDEIAKILNKKGIKSFAGDNGWYGSYIQIY